jgi:hypothetical protein
MAENSNESNAEKPKIIVDDDWKTQAQEEKKRLEQEVESQAGAGSAAGPQDRELPPASFETLVSTIATQVIMALGGMQDPRSGKPRVDLDLAKFHIDCLSLLEDKTRGNLTDEEKSVLDQVLYETRMHYVQIAQQAQ